MAIDEEAYSTWYEKRFKGGKKKKKKMGVITGTLTGLRNQAGILKEQITHEEYRTKKGKKKKRKRRRCSIRGKRKRYMDELIGFY